jgi:methyl coenzyme M reductase subunit C
MASYGTGEFVPRDFCSVVCFVCTAMHQASVSDKPHMQRQSYMIISPADILAIIVCVIPLDACHMTRIASHISWTVSPSFNDV